MRGQHRWKLIRNNAQEKIFDLLNLAAVTERREQVELSKSMGFAHQWNEHRRFQMDFLKNKGLKDDSEFLEIGSGPLTLGIPLIGYLKSSKYTGVDVRSSVMSLAYKQIAVHELCNKNPRLIVSEKFGDNELADATFDIIWSFSVLFHLHDKQVYNLFNLVSRRMKNSGKYWANINIEMEESKWLEFPFVRRDVDFYNKIAREFGLEVNILGPLSDLGFKLDSPEKHNVMLEFSHIN